MMTESNVIGYVQGMESDNMNLFGIGYIAGAQSVNADVTVLQYNANSFNDSAAGSAAVTNFVTQGADIVYHAAGGTGSGVISGCQENKIYAIGVDCDQSYVAPETVITSAMKRVDIAVQDVSKAVKNGNYAAGVNVYDINNGGVDIAPTKTLLPAEVVEAVEAAKADLQSGAVVVPTTREECPAFTLK